MVVLYDVHGVERFFNPHIHSVNYNFDEDT